MPARSPLQTETNARPPTNLVEVFRQANAETLLQEEQAQRRAEQECRRREEQERRQALRDLFDQTYVVAAQVDQDLANPKLAEELTARIMAVGQGIMAQQACNVLDGLPTPDTPDTPHFLPLRFAIGLLKAASEGNRPGVRAAADELRAHHNLRTYWQWFPGLADRFCGYVDVLPGVPGKCAQPLPVDAGSVAPVARQQAAQALGLASTLPLPRPSSPTRPPSFPPAAGARNLAVHSDQSAVDDPDVVLAPDERLSRRQYDILEALYHLEAFTCDASQPTTAIARKAEGLLRAGAERLKKPITVLKQRKLVDTKIGRGGGCWLTQRGQALIKRLRDL